jgi:hypothetical protein
MPKGISLHIGLNRVDPAHYAGWDGRLNACESDAEDTAQLARPRVSRPKSSVPIRRGATRSCNG